MLVLPVCGRQEKRELLDICPANMSEVAATQEKLTCE